MRGREIASHPSKSISNLAEIESLGGGENISAGGDFETGRSRFGSPSVIVLP